MDSNPRIMVVIDHTDSGGAQGQLVLRIKNLRDSYDFSVVVLGRIGRFSEKYRELGIPVSELGTERNRFSLAVFFPLLKLIRYEKPDIIHAHLFRSLILAPLAAWLTGRKCILHDDSALNQQSLRFYFPNALIRLVFSSLYQLSLLLGSQVLTLTGFNREDYLREFKVPAAKVEVLPNSLEMKESNLIDDKGAVDLREFLHLSLEVKIIMMVGRLSPEKDWPTFLDVAARFPENSRYAFLVIGSGFLESALHEMAADRSLKNLHFLGERHDVPQLLKQGDVFMLTSRQEAFGNVILEAMAAGLPVVASRTPGAGSIIQHDQTGLLVEMGDVDGFTQSLDNILTHPSLAKRLVENAAISLPQYSTRQVSAKLDGIYKKVLYKGSN